MCYTFHTGNTDTALIQSTDTLILCRRSELSVNDPVVFYKFSVSIILTVILINEQELSGNENYFDNEKILSLNFILLMKITKWLFLINWHLERFSQNIVEIYENITIQNSA